MKTKLTLARADGSTADLLVTVDADCTVGALADRIGASDPAGPSGPGLTIVRAGTTGSMTLSPSLTVVDAGLAGGTAIALAPAPPDVAGSAGTSVATLTVHSGPDAGRTFELRSGANLIGRGRQCHVQLTDPMVSTTHARLHVGDTIELSDENSSNGILMGGQQVSRVTITEHDRVVLGEDVLSVRRHGPPAPSGIAGGTVEVEFNRSPRVAPPYEGPELVAPEPPTPPQLQRFPVAAALMPLVLGVILYAVVREVAVVLFIALSPLLFVATWWENRVSAKRAHQEAVDNFRANLAELNAALRTAQDEERRGRAVEHPGTAEVLEAATRRDVLLWTRRPEHTEFMELRLGLGTQTSRVRVDVSVSRNSTPELASELTEVVDRFALVDRVPIVGSFERSGSIGISGEGEAMMSVARGIVLQLAGLHSPAEVVLCGVASAVSAPRWDWIKWLPHTTSDHSPLDGPHLATTPPGCSNLVAELADLISARSGDRSGDGQDRPALPRVVLLVEDDAPVERNRLVSLAERGPAVGVHLIWIAPSTANVPAACRTFVEIDPGSGAASTGRVVEGELSHPVLVEPVDHASATTVARALAPVVDAGALPDDQSDLPSTVSFLADAGIELGSTAAAILDRWTESGSVFPPSTHPPSAPRPVLRRDPGLRALVGRGKGDNVYLDLRSQGPHALVGGTTGSGKSEFLQTWIMGMASAHGPQRVTFLFVDYKGGAAFADCVRLPHCVGLVTDLSPLLVRRALTSLRAELRHREHLLNRHRAKDLAEMEATGNPEAPPSLVIVVDEFAALVQEVPEFVDGVVDVAQRGRSLGLHLILATQRPAGVIKDNLRANTNLRVALRMADEDDSRDVIGTTSAAAFDPGLPGRAVAKTGPGRLTTFQSGYVGGWTRNEARPPRIELSSLGFASMVPWELPDTDQVAPREDPGPTDIHRLTDRIIEAAASVELPAARRPWLPELSPIYSLAELQLPRTDTHLVFGVEDDPDAQEQRVVAFEPDLDGNMAVYGTGGSGKTTFLRTLAVSAGLTLRGGPCVVYGLDFGGRGLQMLEALPHVGSIVAGDDHERVTRLLRQLRETIDERAARYAAVSAGSIGQYRAAADAHDEPRVLVLVDGMGAFRSAYDTGDRSRWLELFQAIAVDGRQVGVHLVVSADRVGAVPLALASSIQRHLALRLSSDMDLVALGAPGDGFSRTTPPGRGFLQQREVQVAVFGGSRSIAAQASAIEKLGRRLRREGMPEAPEVRRLPEWVHLDELSAAAASTSTGTHFALGDEDLAPVGFTSGGPLLVAGPSGSGRSTTVVTLVEALRRSAPSVRPVLLGPSRSQLAAHGGWDRQALGEDAVTQLAEQLTAELTDGAPTADLVVVIEAIGEFLNSSADYSLVELLRACRSAEVTVIAEGETPTLAGSWPLLSAVKSARHGIVLQPDQLDGDALLGTSFGRMSRAEFPVGRGMYVRSGRAIRVQVAVST